MLSEEKLTELFRYSFSLIDSRMTPNQQAFCRAIESAATAPLLARIAELEAANEDFGKRQEWWNTRMLELERELEEARKDAEELKFLNGDLLYWVARAVSKGNANSDTEDAYERYEQWLSARHNAAIKEQT